MKRIGKEDNKQHTNLGCAKSSAEMRLKMKIGFIGLGNMASAMIGGIIKNQVVESGDIYGSDHFKEAVDKAQNLFRIQPLATNVEVAKKCDVLVLSVKPQFYVDVITEIKDVVKEDTLIITIAPGKTLKWLSQFFGGTHKIIRCMPNTPALVGEGCTGVCKNEYVTKNELNQVLTILNSFGKAYEVAEYMMDAVVSVSGSSPAYVFMLIEAMADGAVEAGMPRKDAYAFAAQAVLGSAKMVLETGKHPGELKDMVCSPAGTTIEAVRVLEEKGFRSSVIEAMRACTEKSKNM